MNGGRLRVNDLMVKVTTASILTVREVTLTVGGNDQIFNQINRE